MQTSFFLFTTVAFGAAINRGHSLHKRQGGSSSFPDFPNGTVACSDFPSQYGPIEINQAGMANWAGGQDSNNGFANTNTCGPGVYCSYGCPAGYATTQWPTEQPANGVSVGGLFCNSNGMLELTQSNPQLCIPQPNTAVIDNQLGGPTVSWCKTNYPGTENTDIPIVAGSGQSSITVTDADTFYQHLGNPTSSQYYVNPIGSTADDCVFSTEGTNIGNWAPYVVGAGVLNGVTWLSIMPNPNTPDSSVAGYDIEIQGDVSASCSIINGVYSGGANGCTVSVLSGQASFVLTASAAAAA